MESDRITVKKALLKIVLPGLLLLLVLWACNAPSFPLPPPGPESFSFEQVSQGQVVLHVDPNDRIPAAARVTVENLALHVWVGGVARSDGSFDSQSFYASDGDIVQVSFEDPGDESRGGSTCLVVGSYGSAPVVDPRCGGFQ